MEGCGRYCVAAVIVFPLFYVADFNSGEKELVNSVGIFCAISATMCSLYGWKVILLLQGYDYDVRKVRRSKEFACATAQRSEREQSSQAQQPSQVLVEKKYSASNSNPFDAVKTKNLLGRREVCREQVSHWLGTLHHTEAMMLMQGDNETPGDATIFVSDDRKGQSLAV
jgi:hypothetical protein